MLDELVAAGCQVLQVIPLDNAVGHRAHCAVVAARVDRLAPLRSYLADEPVVVDGESPDLRALLRLTGERVFTDLLERPLRQRLADAADRITEQDKRIQQLEKEIAGRDATIAKLRASTAYQVGATVVQGARRPGKAIVSVPVGLVRIWRKRDGTEAPGAKKP